MLGNRGFPEAWSCLCVCQASFLMTFAMGGVPHAGPRQRSLIFLILLFSSISLHWSPRKAFLFFLAVPWNSAFKWIYLSFSHLPFTSLLFSGICKTSSDNYFAFLHFFFLGMVLITASCTMSWTFIHSSSGTQSIRSNPLNLFVTSTV